MHSESMIVHEVALNLFYDLGETNALKYERLLKDIMDQCGRYPYCNQSLGRIKTNDEKQFLQYFKEF
jgi:uncharacterized protein (DUF924 family)